MLVEQELRGNPEHTGISKIMPLILFGSIALFFVISYWLLPILFGGDEVEYIIIDRDSGGRPRPSLSRLYWTR